MVETPIAPPNLAAPVPPPGPASLTPDASGQPPVPFKTQPVDDAVSLNSDPVNDYENAASNRDPVAFRNLQKNYPDTLVADAAGNAADKLDKRLKVVNDIGAIDLSQTTGRQQFQKVVDTLSDRDKARAAGYETIADNPRIGDALVKFLLGDKAGAVMSITGGNVKTFTEFDDKGKIMLVNRNDLGQVDSVYDASHNLIPYAEYLANGGSRALPDTLSRRIQTSNLEKNTAAFATASENNSKALGVLDAAAQRAKRQQDLYPIFKGFTPKQQQVLSSYDGVTTGVTQNLNRMLQFVNQANIAVGEQISAEDAKSLGGGVKGALTFEGNNTWKDTAGNRFSADTLKNLLKSQTNSSNVEQTYRATQRNLAEQMLAQGLGPAGLAAVKEYFDLEEENQKAFALHADKMPGFIELPTSKLDIADQPTRLLLHSMQTQKAYDQMKSFYDFRKKNYDFETGNDKSFTPEPGRYEGAFVGTSQNQDLNNKYNQRAKEIIRTQPPVITDELLPKQAVTGALTPELKSSAEMTQGELKAPAILPSDEQQKVLKQKRENEKAAAARQKADQASKSIQDSLKNKFGGKK
jgi:hypothetical protein